MDDPKTQAGQPQDPEPNPSLPIDADLRTHIDYAEDELPGHASTENQD